MPITAEARSAHMEAAEEVADLIAQAFEALKTALGLSRWNPWRPYLICLTSRTLVNLADAAAAFPEVWSQSRVEEAIALLNQAGAATHGTKWEENCANRAEVFQKDLDIARRTPLRPRLGDVQQEPVMS